MPELLPVGARYRGAEVSEPPHPVEARPPVGPTLAPDRLIAGRYRLVRRLARGGMAEVWEASDEVLSRPVAVKVLLAHLAADEAFVTRFRREAVAAARLSHPHIVAIYDTASDGVVEAIVMELVRGRTLRQVLDEDGALPARQAVTIACQVADALDAAHRQGLIHRDVKPGNILLTDDGRVLVADFGIAKATEASADLTEVGQVVGTAKYLSPEQVEGAPLDARSDIYALGVVLYELLCGRPPFAGGTPTATAAARLTTDPLRPRQVRPGIPRSLEAVILRAMARDPGARYSSAAELRVALQSADLRAADDFLDPTTAVPSPATGLLPSQRRDDHTPAPSPAPGAAPQPLRSKRRRPAYSTLVLLLIIMVTLGLVGVLLARTDAGRDLFSSLTEDAISTGGPSVDLGNRATRPDEITSLEVVETASFDPEGTGTPGERDDLLGFLVDRDPATEWRTETYTGGFTKRGVGVVLTLDQRASLDELTVTSTTSGWSAGIYTATAASGDLDGWGEAVTSRDGIDGSVTFDLEGREGIVILVWITAVGDDPPRVEVGEVEVRG